MTIKFKYSVVIAKKKHLAEFRQVRGWMEPSFSTHQTTKYGWEITNHALRRNVTLSILKNISKRTFDSTNKVILIYYKMKTEQIARFF
jgi:hypothetical protein